MLFVRVYGGRSMGESRSLGARFEDFVRRTKMIFRMATMPSSKEIWQLLRIILLSVVVLGVIGFTIRILIPVSYTHLTLPTTERV